MTFSIFEILIIIGLVQGLVTAVLLLSSQNKQFSQRILGITVLVFCIAISRTLLHSSGLWNHLNFRYFPVGMELLLPPLVYLYVLSLTELNFRLQKKYLLYFLPGLFYAINDITVYIWTLPHDTFEGKRMVTTRLYYDQLNQFEDYLIVVVTLVFVFLGFQRIRNYLTWLRQFKEHRSLPIYRWLRSVIMWSSLLGLVLLLNELLDTFALAMDIQQERWHVFNLCLALLTYYLGFMGYRQDGLRVHESPHLLNQRAQKLKSGNPHDLERKLIEQLERHAVYLDADMTLKQLAKTMGTSTESLSLLINQKFGLSFRDLINSYRVNHFKKMASKQGRQQASILTMALDSGFNSQASFYRAFKKFEGCSPKVFIDRLPPA